jgi:hypothetical protein
MGLSRTEVILDQTCDVVISTDALGVVTYCNTAQSRHLALSAKRR